MRTPGEQDRREVVVRLTPSGEALLEKLSVTHRQELQVAGPTLAKALSAAMANVQKRRREVA
jgi:DNA-binding MarR family transcriptional regulator